MAEARSDTARAQDSATVRLAGVSLTLETGGCSNLRDDSLWRVRARYAPFLATQQLPAEGVTVDIGAGFGAFALPFAMRYPGWEVWCFEPDPQAFAALVANIRQLSLRNVRALSLAIGPRVQSDAPQHELARALRQVRTNASGADRLTALCPPRQFFRHKDLPAYRDIAPEPTAPWHFDIEDLPCLPADALTSLAPDLVKITAPGVEEACLAALTRKRPRWLVGESWRSLPARLADVATRGAWLPFAKAPDLALRKPARYLQKPQGLDLVVHAGHADLETLKATTRLLDEAPAGTRMHVVVDPDSPVPAGHSLPGCALHRAARPGFGAAQNLGRQFASSSHIAFLDIADRPAPGALAALFELARLTQAEVVQGGTSRGPRWVQLPADTDFSLHETSFPNQTGGILPAAELMARFAPTRARIYRRDFLDAYGIGFSETLSGFDDFFLQGWVMMSVGRVPVLPSAWLDEAQASAPRDATALFLPEALRRLVRQMVVKGWEQPAPLLDAFEFALIDLVPQLTPAIMPRLSKAVADVLVATEMALGGSCIGPVEARAQALPIIGPKVLEGIAARHATLGSLPQSAAFAWLDTPLPDPDQGF